MKTIKGRTFDSLDVELLNKKIAALEVQVLEQDDTIEALNRWIVKKNAQCIKCRANQKVQRDALRRASALIKAGMDSRFLQPIEEEGCCGGNKHCEGEDCC